MLWDTLPHAGLTAVGWSVCGRLWRDADDGCCGHGVHGAITDDAGAGGDLAGVGQVGPAGRQECVTYERERRQKISTSAITLVGRAGYRSKMFDIDINTDTLTSIPVPERYFFRYHFFKINFNKITLLYLKKKTGFIFSACWRLYRLKGLKG